MHSQWLTLANRVLRLYASVSTPSENLKTLTDFIINVYAPTFDIKCQPKRVHGPMQLWNMIRRMQHLSETLRKKVLESVVKRGAYYAHQENALIAMINDDNMTIRELGFRRILKVRRESEETPRDSSIIRQFDVPEININPALVP